MTECNFQPYERKNGKQVYRCASCANAVYSEDGRIGRAKCQSANPKDPSACIYNLGMTEETVQCNGCKGSPRIHGVSKCEIHKRCVWQIKIGTKMTPVVQNCRECDEYQAEASQEKDTKGRR